MIVIYRTLVLNILLLVFIGLFISSGCVSSARHPSLQIASLPELIPRESFFDLTKGKSDFQISPDGKQVAWLESYNGHKTIYYKKIGADKIDIIKTKSWCNVSWYKWAQDNRYLIYILDAGRNRAQHIFRSDSQHPDSDPVNLTPDAKNMAWFLGSSVSDPEHILLAQNKHRSGSYDFYKVNFKSGDDELIGHSKREVVQWITDQKGNLRGRIRADSSNDWHLEACDAQQAVWTKLATWSPKEDIENFGFTPNGKGIWLLSNRNRDRMSLVRFDLNSKKETIICENSSADIENVYISHITGKPLFAYSYPDYPQSHILDPEFEKDLAAFDEKSPSGIEILSLDDQEQLLTIKVFNEKEETFYLYDRRTKQKKLLGVNKWIEDISPLAETEPVNIQSRDGMTLRGYLTRPAGVDSMSLPMVLYVHGGPWARDYWQSDRMVQFLANRGYAVLQVNYRGSTGYGRAYKEAAMKEFARNMHNDLIDSVNWAINKNIADPKKIAIVGGSYGGFAAMAGLTFTPDAFSCAISINGVSDWNDFINSFPSDLPFYRKRGFETWYDYVGNPEKNEEKTDIESRSPFYFADRVKKPILIIYGDQDRTVSPWQSEKMIEALKTHGKSVMHKRFENEGHGIHWIHNSINMFKQIETFLASHLGGRNEG